MPLTDHQAEVARSLSANRSFDSYLAGGAAILIEPNTTRYSRSKRAFVDPRGVADALPHFGRPGGVVPRVESP